MLFAYKSMRKLHGSGEWVYKLVVQVDIFSVLRPTLPPVQALKSLKFAQVFLNFDSAYSCIFSVYCNFFFMHKCLPRHITDKFAFDH